MMIRSLGAAWMARSFSFLAVLALLSNAIPRKSRGESLWDATLQTAAVHRFSTLFTAHDVKNHLSTPTGRDKAKGWCRDTGVTHVYIESFRDGYQADRDALVVATKDFEASGFKVSGCVTTTEVGKQSTGWKPISCYSDPQTQERIKQIFEFTSRLFDEIMIDDFWFTDCACPVCEAALKARTVRIGAKEFPVSSDTWEAYRCELMVRLSQEYVLAAARAANPKARIIIKYPQWYDRFQDRGYEVRRETADFDRIWVGTETRDYDNKEWGGTPQYEAYFIMRWLGEIGAGKCGGGWYDWLGTTPKTYLEQARQTVLAGAKESLLFCYGGLQDTTGPGNIGILRQNVSELQRVAGEVQKRRPIGVAAYKPINSQPDKEARVFDFVGMLGIPLLPAHVFPAEAPAAFFSTHALSDPAFREQFVSFVRTGRPVLITDGLAGRLGKDAIATNIIVLPVGGEPKSLLALDQSSLRLFREPLLKACNWRFEGPNRVALYPFSDGSWVVENFRDDAADVVINGEILRVGPRDWALRWK